MMEGRDRMMEGWKQRKERRNEKKARKRKRKDKKLEKKGRRKVDGEYYPRGDGGRNRMEQFHEETAVAC